MVAGAAFRAGENLRRGIEKQLIRFVELFLHMSFRQSVAHLQQELALRARSAAAAELLVQTAAYYQLQLHRSSEAVRYLEHRGLRDSAIIEELGIGYAPKKHWLASTRSSCRRAAPDADSVAVIRCASCFQSIANV
jgi:DNA primase